MAKQFANIQVNLRFEYDEESDGFKDAMDAYQRIFKINGTADDLLNHVAEEWVKSNSGQPSLYVDSVGYVKLSEEDMDCFAKRFYTEIELTAEVTGTGNSAGTQSAFKPEYQKSLTQVLKNLISSWNRMTPQEREEAARNNTGAR